MPGNHSALLRLQKRTPLPPALQDEAERAWQTFTRCCEEYGLEAPAQPDFLAATLRVWALSPFVAEYARADPAAWIELVQSGDLLRAYAEREYRWRLATLLTAMKDPSRLGPILRRFRGREMVRIAFRDLAGWATLDETLAELSGLADACIDQALTLLYEGRCRAMGIPMGQRSNTPQQMVILGMGKLGARELNFSSDIDLIFAYREEGETHGRRTRTSNEAFFVALGRDLIQVLDEKTEDGFVFRVDMRLRPFGKSGPLAMGFDALEDYYQTHGREWERYALIKARPVAGDLKAGASLLAALRPFVFRRYLDFGAFEALREMKAMIDREAERREFHGHIKLGPGGIREIEFIGQAFQLIRGGREPALQQRAILKVLNELASRNHLPTFVHRELAQAYEFLRRTENRLQALHDRQTHTLPEDPSDRLRVAVAMGFNDWQGFDTALNRQRRTVHNHFEQVFSAPQVRRQGDEGPDDDLGRVWKRQLDGDAARTLLTERGYRSADEVLRRLSILQTGHGYRALSTQGRDRMDRLMPLILGACAAANEPDLAFTRILNLVESVTRRTAYLSLMSENPMVLSQLVKLCSASPWIADLLADHPLLLDELIDPRALYTPPRRTQLQAQLDALFTTIDPDDVEQQMDALRHFKQTNVLKVAAADVMGALPLMVVSDHLTEIAEVVLTKVLEIAGQHLDKRHPQAAANARDHFVIIAYGKLGGIELGYGSDLDLVFLHEDQEDDAILVLYPRLAQRIIHLLNTPTSAGILYEVDIRLRPSGASGLLVSSLKAFADYQQQDAWTWEHQALVRARPIAGNRSLGERFSEIRRETLGRTRDPEVLRREVREMRERMRAELSKGNAGRFDVKQDRGGLVDIEFIVQYLVLRWAATRPTLLQWTDNIRILETLAAGDILESAEAQALMDAYRRMRKIAHRLALQEQKAEIPEADCPQDRERVAAIWARLFEA